MSTSLRRPFPSLATWLTVGLLLLFTLVGFAGVRRLRPIAPDANYYHHIARHVARGEGFKTSVSLYHQGLRDLPQPATIYPLWPLVLGGIGKVADLERVGQILPRLLWLLDLILVYLFANRLARALGDDAAVVARFRNLELNVGHLALLLWGTNHVFFFTTTYPYTEGLAFLLLFATLLALERASRDPRLRWAALAGALAGATYLTRSQMFVVPLAVSVAFLLGGRRSLPSMAVALSAAVLVCAPQIIYLRHVVTPWVPAVLVDFSAYRQSPDLPPFQMILATSSWREILLDRLHGCWVAFHPFGRNSYASSVGASLYLVPLALLVVLFRPAPVRAWLTRAPRRRLVVPLATLLCGSLLLAQTHFMHVQVTREWVFGWRHGLPVLLVIMLAIIVLNAYRARWLRALVLLLVVVSAGPGFASIAWTVARRAPRGGPNRAEQALAAWVRSQPQPPVLLSSKAQWLGYVTEANLQWTFCEDDPAQTRRLIAATGIDYIVVYQADEACSFVRELLPSLRQAVEFGSKRNRIRVYQTAERNPS